MEEAQPTVITKHEAVESDSWSEVMGIPCRLTAEFPITGLKVGDLLRLERGSIIDGHQNDSTPIPIWVNGVMLGWAEFDVVGKRLAIRVTELK